MKLLIINCRGTKPPKRKETRRTESSTTYEVFYCNMAGEKKHKQSSVKQGWTAEKPASEISFGLMLHFVFYEANAYTSITGVVSNTVTFVFRPVVAQGTCWIFSTLTLAIYFTDRSCKVLQQSQFGNAIQMKLLQTIFSNIFKAQIQNSVYCPGLGEPHISV